jgi:GntR family transcriptional repressor for pyruvate dehydrogenase complex
LFKFLQEKYHYWRIKSSDHQVTFSVWGETILLERIRRSKLYEEIIQQIKGLIATNQMAPGDRLPSEREMSENFGVSRSAVREALCALDNAGLIEIKHGSGVYLKDVNEKAWMEPLVQLFFSKKENLLGLLELRMGLESEAAALAALRAKPENIMAMEQALQQIEQELKGQGQPNKADFRFHCALAEAAGNSFFTNVLQHIREAFQQGLQTSHGLLQQDPDRRRILVPEHRAILDAIKNRDPEEARLALRYHLGKVKKRLLQINNGMEGNN